MINSSALDRTEIIADKVSLSPKTISSGETVSFSLSIGTVSSFNKAYKFISQAILGSAKMVRDLHIHPGELKDMVTSPAGTTIEGVKALEENNFRYALMEAVKKATKRSRELGKK